MRNAERKTAQPFPLTVLEARVLESADRLVRDTVAATAQLAPQTPPSLGRTLREAAARAQAAVVDACAERSPRRAVKHVATCDHGLRRLGTWIDLAERFGDLPTDAALELLETQSRLLVGLEELVAGWCCERGAGAPVPTAEAAWSVIELVVPDFARS
ncbi:MAG TPA: hypothetical protein VKU40_10155 [Thermoanaerobaculia bacterium]|nr:hypothetical protein [Thermoanaerobaculia bacterium]